MLTVAAPWSKFTSNIGVIVRTCEALNAQAVVPYTTSITPANTPKYVPLMLLESQIERWIKQQAWKSTLVCIETGGSNIFDLSPSTISGDITLILGHETTGTPKSVLEIADHIVSIPQLGQSPSLNVSVAASMAAYWFAGVIPS